MQIWVDKAEIVRSSDYVLTLGTFDGIHLGHSAMIDYVVESARKSNGKSVAITLHPHPRVVLGKAEGLELLSSLSERIMLFRKSGIDILYIMRFDKELSRTPADVFVMENLYGDVGFSKLVVGYDHAFGKDREGDVELLNKLASENGFDIERFGAKSVGDIVVSSTKIRTALKNSEIQAANQMLGYDYFVIGKVVEGDKRGRTIGFPTANVEPDEPLKLLPGNGVYAVSLVDGDKWYAGVCNIGHRPTFRDDSQKTVEVHIPDSTLDLYGKQVRVVFHSFVRDEKKFQGVDQIVSQIEQDIKEARKSLKDLDSISEYINFADYIDIQNS